MYSGIGIGNFAILRQKRPDPRPCAALLSMPDLLEAQLNSAMIKVAREVSVVADASKIGRRSLSPIGDVNLVKRVITNDRLTEEMAAKLRKSGVEVIVV
jgi:DeoR/GlpR family transcriptional regulator of sugar metabolism